MEDIFIAIGFIVFCLAIIYYFGQCMSFNTSIIEGLENKPDEAAAKPTGGVGANAVAVTRVDLFPTLRYLVVQT